MGNENRTKKFNVENFDHPQGRHFAKSFNCSGAVGVVLTAGIFSPAALEGWLSTRRAVLPVLWRTRATPLCVCDKGCQLCVFRVCCSLPVQGAPERNPFLAQYFVGENVNVLSGT